MEAERPTRSKTFMQVRAPIVLADAVKAAADRELTTTSEFVRRALIEKLRRDGNDPAKIETRPAT